MLLELYYYLILKVEDFFAAFVYGFVPVIVYLFTIFYSSYFEFLFPQEEAAIMPTIKEVLDNILSKNSDSDGGGGESSTTKPSQPSFTGDSTQYYPGNREEIYLGIPISQLLEYLHAEWYSKVHKPLMDEEAEYSDNAQPDSDGDGSSPKHEGSDWTITYQESLDRKTCEQLLHEVDKLKRSIYKSTDMDSITSMLAKLTMCEDKLAQNSKTHSQVESSIDTIDTKGKAQ